MKNRKACSIIGWILLGSILCLPVSSNAQESSFLRIFVLSDDDGTPVSGANILIYNVDGEQESELVEAGVSDRDGFAEFRGILPERYLVKVRFVGFETHEEIIHIESGDRKEIRVFLNTSVEQFDDVVVEAQRELSTGEVGIRKVSVTDISRIPTPGPAGDLASYLQTVPGVVSVGDRGGELFIRGGTPDQNVVLVDNLPIIKPFHISNLFSTFSDQTVRNVDLYAGGFPAEYLGGTSSVIDVQLRPGNMREFGGDAAISPVIASIQVEGPIERDRRSLLINGRMSTVDRFGKSLSGEKISYNFFDIVSRYTIQGDDLSCNVTGIYTSDKGLINPERDLQQSWSNRVLGSRCLYHDVNLENSIEFTFGYTGYNSSEGAEGQIDRSSKTDQFYANVDLEKEVLGQLINYGFGINYKEYRTSIDERFTNLESFKLSVPSGRIYISTEIEFNEKMSIEPGVGSQISSNNSVSLEPRFRISYQPGGTDAREFSLALGRYNQLFSGISDQRDAGSVFTVLKPVDNEEPLPSAVHGIAAYQQKLGRWFTANVEGYIKHHKNTPIPKWTPEARLELETALADGLAYGFDLRMEYESPLFFAALGYGWSRINYEASSGDLGAWIEEPVFEFSPAHDQRHVLNALFSFELAGFETGVRWNFGSGRPYTKVFGFDMALNLRLQDPLVDPGTARTLYSEPYGSRQPVQHRLDVSVKRLFRITTGASITAEVGAINAYNRRNIFFLDLNTLQRVDQTPLLPYFSIKTRIN